MPTISAVTPVCNAAHSLEPSLHEQIKTFNTVADASEILMVEDPGEDNALLCGIPAAQYEVIVTLDDGLQIPPDKGRCPGSIPLRAAAQLTHGYQGRPQHRKPSDDKCGQGKIGPAAIVAGNRT